MIVKIIEEFYYPNRVNLHKRLLLSEAALRKRANGFENHYFPLLTKHFFLYTSFVLKQKE